MSVVASRLQPNNSITQLNGHHLTNGSTLKTSGKGSASLIENMLAAKQHFGEPVGKNTLDLKSGVREVLPGPRSPKANGNLHLPNGHGHGKMNGHGKHDIGEGESEGEEQDEEEEEKSKASTPSKDEASSSSTLIGPTLPPHLTTPSRKGKEPATSSAASSPFTPLPTPRAPRAAAGRSLYEDPIDLTWPTQLRARKQSAAGLYNPSMACYANATLQVLLHTPPVLRIAQSHTVADCKQQASKGWCMLCALKKLVQGEHWGSTKAYPPRIVHDNLKNIKKGFSKNRQEDSHEFFRFVTDALQNTALCGMPKDLPAKVKHTTWVYQTWGGEVRSRVVCSKCRKPSDTFDNFLDLSLDVPKGQKSVKTMMQGFIREDKLEGDNKYHCENCKSKANATKSFKILHAPPILTLHLKRFAVNYGYNGKPRANKNTQFIEYPESLDIAPYMVDPKSAGCQYRLFGVTCHRGSELRFGHYTSYVRGPQGAWFHADDEDMMAVPTSQVLRESSAYLLSYIRVGEGSTQPASAKSTPLQTNGHTPLSKKRRDRDSDDEDEPLTEALTPKTKKAQAQQLSSPAYAPSDEEEEEQVERTPRNWKFKGRDDVLGPRANVPELLKQSPIDRPSHPSPGAGAGASRAERRKEKRKRSKGAPNPYKFSSSPSTSSRREQQQGGFRRSGLGKGMKPRQKVSNGRASFRG